MTRSTPTHSTPPHAASSALMAAPSLATHSSTSASLTISGGTRRTTSPAPAVSTSRPASRARATTPLAGYMERGGGSWACDCVDGVWAGSGTAPRRDGPPPTTLAHPPTHRNSAPPPHPVQLHTTDQAQPPHVLDAGHARQLGPQAGPQALAARGHAVQEGGVVDDAKHRLGSGAHQGIARKRGPVVPGRHGGRHPLRQQHRPDRQAARKRFGQRHDVWRHPKVLVAPQAPGAPQADLHLVKHQQGARFVARPPQAAEEVGRRGVHAALALQRLHKHGARLALGQHSFGRLQIQVRHAVRPGQARRKGRLVLGLVRERQRAHCAPVEAVVERQQAVGGGGGGVVRVHAGCRVVACRG